MISAILAASLAAPSLEPYSWRTLPIGGGGAIVSTFVHPLQPVTYLMGDVSGLWRWNEEKKSWKYLSDSNQWSPSDLGVTHWSQGFAVDPSDNTGNFVCAIQGHPLAGKMWGRFLYSYDQGDTWKVNKNVPFETRSMPGRLQHAMAVDPASQKVVYFAANDGLWRTTNLGSTWQKLPGPLPGATLVVPDPASEAKGSPRLSERVYAAFNEIWTSGSGRYDKERILYVSNDAGQTWQLAPGAPSGIRRLFLLPHGGLLTAGKSGIHRLNKGVWTDLTPRSGNDWVADFDPKRPDHLAAVDACYPNEENKYRGGEFFASQDGGRTWKSLNGREVFDFESPWMKQHGPKMASWALGIDPHKPGRVWFGDYYSPFTSADFWAEGQVKWQQRVRGFEELVLAGSALTALPAGPALLLYGVADNGAFVLESLSQFPRTNIWQRGLEGRNTAFTGFDYAGYDRKSLAGLGVEAWGGGGVGFVAESLDGGRTWRYLPGTTKSGGALALAANGKAMACGGGHGVEVSWDGGRTWLKTLSGWSGSDEIFQSHNRVLGSDKVLPEAFYRYDGDKSVLDVSQDGGRTWVPLPAPSRMGDLRVHPWKAGEVWLAGEKGLAATKDGGRTFAVKREIGEVWSFGIGLGPRPKTISLYIAARLDGQAGFFRSDDEGASWKSIAAKNSPTQEPKIEGDLRKWGRCFVATQGTGLWIGEPK